MAIESANAKDEIPMENHAYTALGWWRENCENLNTIIKIKKKNLMVARETNSAHNFIDREEEENREFGKRQN